MRPTRTASTVVAAAIALGAAAGGAAANLHLLQPRERAAAPLRLDEPASTDTTIGRGGTTTDEPGQPPGDTTTTGVGQPGRVTTTGETPPATVPPASPTTSPPGTSPPGTSPPATAPQTPTSTRSYAVGDAGSVVLSLTGGRLTVDAIRPAGGWTYTVARQTTTEAEITFRAGEQEAALHAQVEGGQLVVEVDGSGEPPDD